MKNKKTMLLKKVQKKNRFSNILIAINIIFGTIPFFIIVMMISMLMQNTITLSSIIIGGAVIIICLILKTLSYSLSIWSAHRAAYGALTGIRIDIIEHLKKMELGFFAKKKTGDLAKIINHDVEQVELYLAHALPEIISTTLIPVAIFIVITIIDWRLGLALISSVPLVLLLRKLLNKIWEDRFKNYSESTRKMSEDLVEYVATIPVIKAFSKEENKTRQILTGMHNYLEWVKKIMLGISVPMGIISMILEAGLGVMIIIGSILLKNNEIVIQKFILSIILGGIFAASFAKMATFQHYRVIFNQAITNIGSILFVNPPVQRNIRKEAAAGDIKINNLSFSYTDHKKTLSQIDLVFPKNSVNAIVGVSGSGKSTLAYLIMGFWQPQEGSIFIGETNIADMTREAISSLVSIVQQDVFLFNLSIAENIRLGKTEAVQEEIIEAAKSAQIHDFIMSLPKGYDTLAGEGGVKFSGGEKQRISIARMILKNAPIIILDEATASIDPNNEHLIQKALSNLGQDKTIITIAHHLNTIIHAEQIVVMDEGHVIQTGTHNELIRHCEKYIRLTQDQTKVDTWKIRE